MIFCARISPCLGPSPRHRSVLLLRKALFRVEKADSWQSFSQSFSLHDLTPLIFPLQVMVDKATGRSRGFGFVTYEYASAIEIVTNKKDHVLEGRTVEVRPCGVSKVTMRPWEGLYSRYLCLGIDFFGLDAGAAQKSSSQRYPSVAGAPNSCEAALRWWDGARPQGR